MNGKKKFAVWLTEEELGWLRSYAELRQITSTEVVRQYIHKIKPEGVKPNVEKVTPRPHTLVVKLANKELEDLVAYAESKLTTKAEVIRDYIHKLWT